MVGIRAALLGIASRWRSRIAVRVVSALVFLSALATVSVDWATYRQEHRDMLLQVDEVALTLADSMALAVPDWVLNDSVPELEAYARDICNKDGVEVSFVRIQQADGKILARHPRQDHGTQALQEMVVRTTKIVVPKANKLLGYVTVGLPVKPWRTSLEARAAQNLVLYAVLFAMITLTVAAMLRTLIGRPLHGLVEHARRIGSGDLGRPVPVEGIDEFGRLSKTMEQMRADLHRSYCELEQQNVELKKVDRLKDQFLANMSHEIRTPLHSVLSCAELLVDSSESERSAYQESLVRNAKHLLALVNQVLDFSKLQGGSFCPEIGTVELSPILHDVVSCMKPQADDKGLQLRLHVRPDVPRAIRTDQLRLREILMNVVGNAIKFTEIGSIVIECGMVESGATPLLEIVVTDTGIGIPVDQQDKLFQPFTQLDATMTRRHGGSGLGLVISRKLAQALGGDVSIGSAPGSGCKVRITVGVGPVADLVRHQPERTPTPAAQEPAKTTAQPLAGRVLLVDDAADNRKLLSVMLSKAGLEVVTAENGEAACKAVKQSLDAGRPYDLVVMDIQMPVLDGCGAASKLRGDGVETPLVALTAHATEQDRQRCREAGFNDYASKPISRGQLTDLVRRNLKSAD
ncbi:MAG: Sensory/regulatory protein RpfC [Planctomycetota bacterium]|jgi:signal transduction histidine kinase/CheY-like chemotaxis protein